MRSVLCAALLVFVLAANTPAQTVAAAALGSEPFSHVTWLVGDWDCIATNASGDTSNELRVHNHITRRPGGDALDFGSTIDARGRTADDVLGFDTKNHKWYEHLLIDGMNRQEFLGGTGALTKRSLVLLGVVQYEGHAVRVRSTYFWFAPNSYRFEGAAFTSAGVWQIGELHDCKRTGSGR